MFMKVPPVPVRALLCALCIAVVALAQPLPDSGGGSSSSSSHSEVASGPTCSSNCRSCTYDYTCDVCNKGYVLTVSKTCSACARNCDNCDQAGPDSCDVCSPRFVMTRARACEPCAANCRSCQIAGPHLCDVCDSGFMLEARTCIPCTAGCRSCHGIGQTDCDECFYHYQLQSDGSCAFRYFSVTLIMVALLILLKIACSRHSSRLGSPSGINRPLSQDEYISSELQLQQFVETQEASTLPSGSWRGYYTFSAIRHDVCEFNLEFDGAGHITGNGTDDVGQYTMEGLYGRSRIAFSKTYIARSENVSGVHHYGNKGHMVEYRGELAGDSLGSGFRGVWTIHSRGSSYTGQFHIWPTMEGWADSSNTNGMPSTGGTFEENECVVCYDRAISTCLRPCGHIALCGVCASQLSPRRCPLCRRPINTIESRPQASTAGRLHAE